ncbi:Rhs element Vgr protein:Gp5-like protein [Plesiocystis pacifica SIR-1]|uniref:Rhs element Vgr protein:Gp5-like protein n=1 Tax=Plesiocystis pacifica SIR-1 TaxID=391625 RepID=A6GJJ6_9BACT|nr:Rhs element Vgr protein:Gp5-like protein [Plesiocystis pacifica SIR-1]
MWIGEGLNTPYRAVIDAETESDSADTDSLLGADAVLTLGRGEIETRELTGVVARVEYLGIHNHNLVARFELVPALELAKMRVDSRIFQKMSVQDIVAEVLGPALGDYGRSHDVGSISRGADPRDYCTQYRESDFDFVTRLLQEEGLSYEFVHDGVETLTLRDANDQYSPIENLDGTPELPVIVVNESLADVESVQAIEWTRQLSSTDTLRRDFDWMTPRNLLTESASGADERGRNRRIYAHGQRRYIADDLADRAIDLRDASRVTMKVLRGQSNCTAMRPGLTFDLVNTERADLEDTYLITRVNHSGADTNIGEDASAGASADESKGVYSNEFECVPLSEVLCPTAASPKPRVHGPQTAIVTGPDGEEIHTDEHGRIQVQFYWEEKPTYTANSSCWIRVRQSWAGLGWGTQFIPRIGMEVVVEFLEGNPDRPMVTGCVYNGEYPPPFSLPDNKTQTGWRTNSSPGGEGFNELRFEDAKDKEEIYVHGQKDWVVEIENDHRETIGHDQHYEIGNDQTEKIGHDQIVDIGNDRKESIGNNVEETVGKVRTVSSGDNMNFTSDAETYIEAADKITLKCGASTLTMDSGGNILVKGSNLTLKASGNIVLNGAKISSN